MKKSYFFRPTLKFSLALLFAISLLGFASSCKDDKEELFEDVSLQFKVDADNGIIHNVVTQVGTSQETMFDINEDSWSSQPKVVNTSVGAIHLAATGFGVDNESKMYLKILVNGEIVAVDTVKGAGNLSAKTLLQFPVVNNVKK